MIGLILVIIAQSFWALELILVRKFFPTQNPIFMAATTSIISSIFYAPFVFIYKKKFTTVGWVVIVVLALFSWFLAQVFFVKGIQMSTNAYLASVVTLVMPLLAAIMSIFLLKEPITLRMIVGGIIMAAGFLVITVK
jgi:drug/metabolite transporter (DMT)-like permease